MSETPRTDEAELYYRDVCEGKDSPLYLVASDFARDLERDLRAAQARLAALLEPGEYDDIIKMLDNLPATQRAIAAIKQLQAKVRELKESTKVTMVMRLRNQYDEQVKRAEQAEARLAEYDELIYEVGTKYPNESRHETALRYIREREQSSVQSNPAGVARRKEGI